MTEDDLLELPTVETDRYEYKSSKIDDNDLRSKIQKAASAFWNSGGGYLCVGIDDNGKIDGGMSLTMGRKVGGESRQAWIDKTIHEVQPQGPYQIHVIKSEKTDSSIASDCAVFIIEFKESPVPPHMSGDKKYYIRAGEHSFPASHFIVEALRTKRIQSPILRVIPRVALRKNHIIEIAVVCATSEPAVDVSIDFRPLPTLLNKNSARSFPIKVPLIDRQNPFSLDIAMYSGYKEQVGVDIFEVIVSYLDLAGNYYTYAESIEPDRQLPPHFNGREIDLVVNAIDKLTDKVDEFLDNLSTSQLT
ncbi:MAG: ATP-binding protein [Chloroflexota bacterium]|nr:ATP-binding protein [Chloroflexota bacterium]